MTRLPPVIRESIVSKAQLLLENGFRVADAARILGVPASTLYRWLAAARTRR